MSYKKEPVTSVWQKVVLITFGIVLFLLLLEGALRVSGYILAKNYNTQNLMYGNSTNKTITILCIGESTTSAWTEQMQDILNNISTAYTYHVINEGVAGTNTATILWRLDNNIKKYNPNAVITMMGVNDWELNYNYDNSFYTKVRLSIMDLRIYKLLTYFVMSDYPIKLNLFSQNNHGIATQSKILIGGKYSDVLNDEYPYVIDKIRTDLSNTDILGEYYDFRRLVNEGHYQEAVDKYYSLVLLTNDSHYKGYLYYLASRLESEQFNHMGRNDTAVLNRASSAGRLSIEYNPNILEGYTNLFWIYIQLNDCEGANNVYNYIEENSDDKVSGEFTVNNINCLSKLNKTMNTVGIKKINLSDYKQQGFELTKENYDIFRNKLPKNVKYFAMMYPRRDISCIKDILHNDSSVIYIENKNNFENALKEHNYNQIFIDSFARPFCGESIFGHTATLGDMLIAKNAAKEILKYYENITIS